MGRVASALQQHLVQAVMLRGSIAVSLALSPWESAFFTLFFLFISVSTGANAARGQPGFTDALPSEVSGWKMTQVGSDADLIFLGLGSSGPAVGQALS